MTLLEETVVTKSALHALADEAGIIPGYHDQTGREWREPSDETRRRLIHPPIRPGRTRDHRSTPLVPGPSLDPASSRLPSPPPAPDDSASGFPTFVISEPDSDRFQVSKAVRTRRSLRLTGCARDLSHS